MYHRFQTISMFIEDRFCVRFILPVAYMRYVSRYFFFNQTLPVINASAIQL